MIKGTHDVNSQKILNLEKLISGYLHLLSTTDTSNDFRILANLLWNTRNSPKHCNTTDPHTRVVNVPVVAHFDLAGLVHSDEALSCAPLVGAFVVRDCSSPYSVGTSDPPCIFQ